MNYEDVKSWERELNRIGVVTTDCIFWFSGSVEVNLPKLKDNIQLNQERVRKLAERML